jgi:hypothetical protein
MSSGNSRKGGGAAPGGSGLGASMSLMGVIVDVVMMAVVVMLVVAIGAMNMRLGADAHMVAMPVMRIAVMRVIMRAIAVIVTVDRRRRDIGAALRVEGGLDRGHFRAEPARHILDHMIAPDAQALGQEFGRQVAIAEMPGDAHERRRVGAADFSELFGRGDDFDDAPVLELEPVAGAQHHRLGQVEQEGEAANARHRNAAPVALVVIEDDGVGRFAGPGAGGTDGMSVLHFWPDVETASR